MINFALFSFYFVSKMSIESPFNMVKKTIASNTRSPGQSVSWYVRTVFNLMAKAIQDYIGWPSLAFVIGLKNSCHPLDQPSAIMYLPELLMGSLSNYSCYHCFR